MGEALRKFTEIVGNTDEHRYYGGVRTEVDTETGELRISAPAGTHKVVSITQSQAFKDALERERYKAGRQPSFTFSFMEEIREVAEVLTTAQCGYLLVLQCYISFDNSRLINADKSPMSTNDMLRILQLTKKRSTFYVFLRKSLVNGIINENADGSYSVNPRYHFRGATDNPYVIKSYTAKVKQVYCEVNAADLGLIYRMLPFVHYDTNTLCANPTEVIPENVRPFNRKQLAEMLGVSPGEISRRLARMTFGNEYVVAKVTIGGVSSYMLNPWVFYRKSSEPDATLRAIFSVKAS